MAKLTITQTRSNIHNNPHQKGTLQALGLGKIGRKVEREDSPQLQGQLTVVSHLVEVEEATDGQRRKQESRADEIGLHNLSPKPGSRRPRKRIGRGQGSGTGKTSGRGHGGQGQRAGNKRNSAHEGGQNPIHMRMRKLRGPHMKKSMPFENFRTSTQPVNLSDLEERFEAGAEVTPETLKDAGLATRSHPGQDPRQGRDLQGPHGPRPWLQRHGEGKDRGCRRKL